MKSYKKVLPIAAIALAGGLTAAQAEARTVELKTAQGEPAGTATLTETPNGVLIAASLKNLSPGWHGFHIHETGACDPGFYAAGGHFAPDGNKHGFRTPTGAHAGDLPNVHVSEDGTAKVEILTRRVTMNGTRYALQDEDGSALIVHAKADSYEADPKAGERVACGVIH